MKYILIILLFPLLPLLSESRTVKFTFNYPDSYNGKYELFHEKTKKSDSVRIRDTIRTRAVFVIKKEGHHFRVQTTSAQSEFSRNGVLVENPALDAVNRSGLAAIIDRNGQFVALRGIQRVTADLARNMKRAEFLELKENLKNLRQQEKSRWHSRIGRWSGQTVVFGQVYEGRESSPFGNHSVNYISRTKVDKFVKCGRHQCVRLVFTFALPKTAVDTNVPMIRRYTISGKGYRIIRPDTLELKEERIEKQIRLFPENRNSAIEIHEKKTVRISD